MSTEPHLPRHGSGSADATGGPGGPEPADRRPVGARGGRQGPTSPSLPDPLQWWLERRRRKRRDPNPAAKGEPYRRPPLWQRGFSIVALLSISVVFGLVLTAAIVVVVAALALALQSAIGT